jgi:hypothetical protein
MRSSKSRSRSKSNRQRSIGNIINRVFDSSGPEGKVRGTPQQIIEKYLMLARDAQLSNDRVAEQSFLQHAEHYTRLLGEAQREMAREQEQRQPQFQPGQGGNGNGNGNGGHTPRERGEQRGDEIDQPDLSPLMGFAEEEGPGLVETPEARQPRVGEAGERPRGERPRSERPPRDERPPRAERADQGAERPAPAEAAQAGDETAKEKPARANPRSRGPRKPRPQSEGSEASQPATEPAPDTAQ